MPNTSKNDDYSYILSVISKYPGGVKSSLIANQIDNITQRTLQRRLGELVKQQKLSRKGWGKSTTYHLATNQIPLTPATRSLKQRNLNLTEQAKQIRQTINQPIELRTRVGYQHDFLARYEPNTSYYLTEAMRQHLTNIGTQPNGTHPAGTFAKQIFNRLIIDLSWNSSRLEGNTYSLLETERLLMYNETISEKSIVETQMILNHKAAIKFLVESADIIGFNNYTILNLHALLSKGLLGNQASSGRIRTIPVGIGGTSYQPINIPQILEERFNDILSKANCIEDPYEQAFFGLIHIPYLQPFEDVNKRTARLSANIPLIKNNLCPLSFIDVPSQDYIDGILGVYELNDTTLMSEIFVWAYERSAARYSAIQNEIGEPDAFRFRFQKQLQDVIQQVVLNKFSKAETTSFLRNWTEKQLAEKHRVHFINVVEENLLALHEGNIAIYGITPQQFSAWQAIWRMNQGTIF